MKPSLAPAADLSHAAAPAKAGASAPGQVNTGAGAPAQQSNTGAGAPAPAAALATRAWQALRGDRLLQLLLAALLPLAWLSATPARALPALVDWPTIAALAGLLALTKALELSGALAWLGHRLVQAMASERRAALLLVAASMLLSTVLTNDVALFVVVPLSLGVCSLTAMPAARLVVFEALAVNAGSALTPIGNPQNLFIWQHYGTGFGPFVWHMLPLAVGLCAMLLALTALAFSGRPIGADVDGAAAAAAPPLQHGLLWAALALYIPFLAATDLHHAGWALLVVLATMAALRPALLAQLDWGLLLVFVLMFVDLRLLAGLPLVQAALQQLALGAPGHAARLYFVGIGASQAISNVPAAIALAPLSAQWQVLAYAVSVGGFGTAVGSLANLIALRMVGQGRAWLLFHLVSLPFLLMATALGYALLFHAG